MIKKKKNILFINHTSNIGGAELVLIDVIKTVADSNLYNVFVIYPTGSSNKFYNLLLSINNIQVIKKLPYRGVKPNLIPFVRNLIYSFYSFFYLLFFSYKNKIDIIYTNTSVIFFGRLLTIILNKTHIWHIHEQFNIHYKWIPNWFVPVYRILFIGKKNNIIFVSREAYNSWSKLLKNDLINSVVIYNKFREINISNRIFNQDNIVIGYLGSFSRVKNLPFFLQCLSNFFKVYGNNNIKFYIGGDGEELLELKQLCLDLHIDQNVKFLGFVDEPKNFFNQIDFFVLPSISESWGLSAVEAVYCNKCLILSKESGLVEIFSNEEDCLIIDPNDESSIIGALLKIVSDKELVERMIANSNAKLKEMNLNQKFDYSINKLIVHKYNF